MINLFVYSVAAFGFAYVVGHSVISKVPRELLAWWAWDPAQQPAVLPAVVTSWWAMALVTMIECVACIGFWTGLIVGAIIGLGWPAAIAPLPPAFLPPALAFYTAGSNFLLGRLTGLMPNPNAEPSP